MLTLDVTCFNQILCGVDTLASRFLLHFLFFISCCWWIESALVLRPTYSSRSVLTAPNYTELHTSYLPYQRPEYRIESSVMHMPAAIEGLYLRISSD